jgi:hypothetical protein
MNGSIDWKSLMLVVMGRSGFIFRYEDGTCGSIQFDHLPNKKKKFTKKTMQWIVKNEKEITHFSETVLISFLSKTRSEGGFYMNIKEGDKIDVRVLRRK